MSVSERVAIAGVTGYIGGRLAPRLLDHGYAIQCLVRSPAKLQSRPWATDPKVQIRRAELADETSLTRDLEGCEAAFYLVHSMMSAGSGYAEHDRQLASTFARASKNAGVKRIIYLGGLGETGPGLSEHLSSRREVEEALASSGVPVTVLRAAMIIGSGSASFEILRYLVERLPIMVTPKWVSTPCQPIAVRNVIGYLVGVLAVPETSWGRIRHWRTRCLLLPRHHAHHGGRTRSAPPSDCSCTRVDATPEFLLDSADHTFEQHHCQPFGGGTKESSCMSRQSHCQSHSRRNFSASARPYTRLSTRWLNTVLRPVGRWLVPFQGTRIGLVVPFSATFARLPWMHLRGRSFVLSVGLAAATGGMPRTFSGRSADGWIS